MVRTARLIGRGFSDTLEHLLPFTLLTLGWWLAVVLIIPAPAAIVTLVALTDPRRVADRPGWRDAWSILRRHLWHGWGVAALTVPLVAVLLANLIFYGDGGSGWGVLIPLWTLLLALSIALTLYALALAGLIEGGAWLAVHRAAFLVARRPLRAIGLVLFTAVAVVIGAALVVPLVMFLPALLAAIVNRLTLDGLGIDVLDPLAPTDERRLEEQRRVTASRFGP